MPNRRTTWGDIGWECRKGNVIRGTPATPGLVSYRGASVSGDYPRYGDPAGAPDPAATRAP